MRARTTTHRAGAAPIGRRTVLRQAAAIGIITATGLGLATTGTNAAGLRGTAGEPPVLVIGQDREPVGFDPVTSPAWASQNIYEHVYEPLLRFDAEGHLTPGLVAAWSQPDELTVILELREGVLFHDGSPMTAADVKFSIDRFRSVDQGSLHSSLYKSIAEVTVVDDFTVQLDLSAQDVGLLNVFASPYQMAIFPEGATDLETAPIGTGPFSFVEYVSGSHATLTKFDDYWNPDQPLLAGIEFRMLPDEETRVAAIRTGEIDMTWVATPAVAASAAEGGDVVVIAEGYNKPVQLYLNNGNEALADVRVRQAISLALDRQEFIDLVAMGDGDFTTAIPSTDTFWAYPDRHALPNYQQDIEQAKALLAEAGYGDGLTLRLQSSDLITHVTDAEILRDQLSKVGITAEISVYDSGQAFANLTARDYDLAIAGGRANADPDTYFYSDFHSVNADSSRTAYPGDPVLDALLDQGRTESDPAVRQGIYYQVQEFIAEQAPMIWLYELPVRWELTSPAVQNYPGIDKFISRSPAMNTVSLEG